MTAYKQSEVLEGLIQVV